MDRKPARRSKALARGHRLSARASSNRRQGSRSARPNIAADRDAILGYYFNNGYPDATFDWTQTPAGVPNRANLHYTIKPGERQFVRDVLVRGLETTRPNVVSSRILIRPGDPISQGRIAETQQKLYDLGIFSKVQTALQNPDGEEESKYVLFQLDEAAKYSFNVGIGAELARIGGGVTTFDSPAGTTGFSPRVSAGISRLNFLGMGAHAQPADAGFHARAARRAQLSGAAVHRQRES